TTTTASVADVVERWRRAAPEVKVALVNDYAVDPAWVAAVAASIREHWQQHGRSQKLMFSFHGLPQRVADAGDPYPQRCEASARAIAA
ncbi:MAG TPA: ferrochelatase, partial [Xanthomonadaceae bacterium]|nr:ferrochelatase [Xanthomonadaceae bacterium]